MSSGIFNRSIECIFAPIPQFEFHETYLKNSIGKHLIFKKAMMITKHFLLFQLIWIGLKCSFTCDYYFQKAKRTENAQMINIIFERTIYIAHVFTLQLLKRTKKKQNENLRKPCANNKSLMSINLKEDALSLSWFYNYLELMFTMFLKEKW